MEKMNALTLIITLVVGVILTGALLGPVISNATETHRTFNNLGAFYVEVDPTDEYSIEYDRTTAPGVISVNGESVSLGADYTFMIVDNAILRYINSDKTIQYRGGGSGIAGIGAVNIVLTNGTMSGTVTNAFSGTTTTISSTYDSAYVMSSEKQEHIMSTYGTPVKMNGDSEIFAYGQTATSFLSKIEGTINDGVNITILDVDTGTELTTATVSNVQVNATAVEGYIDLYNLDSITYTVTLSDNVVNVTYSAYIVPESVTAERSDHLTPGQISLMGAIPVMVIVALLMLAVGAIAYRRAD